MNASRQIAVLAGSMLLLVTDAVLADNELWSRGLLGAPSSAPFQPFNVVIIESVVGNHLVGTCSYANYTDGKESPPAITVRGVKMEEGKFCPRVTAKVTNDVNGEWTTIGELGTLGKPASRRIAANSIDDTFTVPLDSFRPFIGKFLYGALVLKTDQAAVFELKDLLPPELDGQSKNLSGSQPQADPIVAASYSRSSNVLADARLGSSIDDFRSVWGPPSGGETLVRTANLRWNRGDSRIRSIVPGVFTAQVAFLDTNACEIILRSKRRVTPKKLRQFAQPLVSSIGAEDFTKAKSSGNGIRIYELSDGTSVSVKKRPRHTVVVLKSKSYLENEHVFDDEAKVRPPMSNH
jgi:hypothetical protein